MAGVTEDLTVRATVTVILHTNSEIKFICSKLKFLGVIFLKTQNIAHNITFSKHESRFPHFPQKFSSMVYSSARCMSSKSCQKGGTSVHRKKSPINDDKSHASSTYSEDLLHPNSTTVMKINVCPNSDF